MHETALEKARELGRLLGQTDEYKALAHAREELANDRGSNELLNRLGDLEGEVAAALQRGQTPGQAVQDEYEQKFSELQASPVYQALVAAQANFDKMLARVNEEIAKGIEAGAKSRIILPS